MKRDATSVLVEDVSDETVTRDLDDQVSFKSMGKNGWRSIMPPPIHKHLLDRTQKNVGLIPYPNLRTVVSAPALLSDGSVHDAPGEYRCGVLFLAPQAQYPRVKDKPTREDAIAALDLFKPIFKEFPFKKIKEEEWYQTQSYSVVLAYILTLVARPALLASVPLFTETAPVCRTGKTMTIEAGTYAALGHKVTTVTFIDEEEFGKQLLPLLMQQDRAEMVDNITKAFFSAKLAMCITGNSLKDRVLGESRTVDLSNRSVFSATGNNLTVGGDLAYRALQIDVDANVERPEERKFDFDPIELARKSHPQLVTAALTALRSYLQAGQPWNLTRGGLGGFVEWDKLVSGCLTWLGYSDPVLTRQAVIGEDPERAEHIEVLQAWYGEFGTEQVTLPDIEKKPSGPTHKLLLHKAQWDARVIGWRFRRMQSRVEGGLKLVKGTNKQAWQVISAGGKTPAKAPDGEDLPF